jgi:catechol 2,3-dioxygenase-like lactoylglutathione lyase family enzyme
LFPRAAVRGLRGEGAGRAQTDWDEATSSICFRTNSPNFLAHGVRCQDYRILAECEGNILIDHMGITVSDLEKSKGFYSKSLAALGYVLVNDSPNSVSFAVKDGYGKSTDPAGDIWLSIGKPMVPRPHFAFSAASRMVVDAFFAAGVAAGGTENGAPRIRSQYHSNYYAAFLLDPDGYNIEAVCHSAADQV